MSQNKTARCLEDLIMVKDVNRELISTIKTEEGEERIESIEAIQNDIKGIKVNTEMKKSNYIIELQSGLGNKVKKNPTTIKKLNNKWNQRLSRFIKGIFTKF